MTPKQEKLIESYIRSKVKKMLKEKSMLKEETWADAAKEVGIEGELDNEFIGYMQELYSAIKNINQYPLERSFPKNRTDIAKMKQGFKMVLENRFGQLFN